jgi:hypothetical protein
MVPQISRESSVVTHYTWSLTDNSDLKHYLVEDIKQKHAQRLSIPKETDENSR